jgi:hypothetical protein
MRAHYVSYFARNPELVGERDFYAADIGAALPDGFGHLARYLPAGTEHGGGLSGQSSQTLALAVLGSSAEEDPALLMEPRGPLPAVGKVRCWQVELKAHPELLNERSFHRTSIDFALEGRDGLVLVEAKHVEEGIGRCQCRGRKVGDCSAKVRSRPYWEAAREHFGLEGPSPTGGNGRPCPLWAPYQAVRNVAMATRLAGEHRQAHWVLIYNEDNPVFAGHQAPGREPWPGWAALLDATLQDSDEIAFRAVSWQQIVREVPLRSTVVEWLRDKHLIGPEPGLGSDGA